MTELVHGNRLTLLESGRAYFPALEAACDALTFTTAPSGAASRITRF